MGCGTSVAMSMNAAEETNDSGPHTSTTTAHPPVAASEGPETSNTTAPHPPDTAAAPDASEGPDINAMSIKELKAHITAAGLTYTDCVEKGDLVARAREANLLKPPPKSTSTTPCFSNDSDATDWPLERLLAYLNNIRVIDKPSSATDDRERMVERVHCVETQCYRIFGEMSSNPMIMMAMMQKDPEFAATMAERMQRGEPTYMAEIMARDVHRMHSKFTEEPESAWWLHQLRPDWSDGVTLVRSIILVEPEMVAPMSRVADMCSCSFFSFSVLVTLLCALRYANWGAALKVSRIRVRVRFSSNAEMNRS